jgi:outer membrane protein insertion porin family
LIERGERRLNGLGYFKKVHISNRPGSSPDRVIVVVEVEDQPTGSISLSGGYSTIQGIMAELAYTETNFLGRGQYVRISVSDGQYSSGWKASFTEPYFLGQRLAAGFDIYHQVNNNNKYALYQNWTTGVTLRLGIPVTDDLTFQPTMRSTSRGYPSPTLLQNHSTIVGGRTSCGFRAESSSRSRRRRQSTV